MSDLVRPRRALLSVWDKAGIADLARALAGLGAELLSTGATAGALRAEGLAVREVAEATGAPEMLGGRVKTLHPAIHGGLLARRDDAGHMAEIAARGIGPIDLVAVDLYPFEATVAAGAPEAEAVERIDVGGPAMLRAAAKNHAAVAALSDPAHYAEVVAALRAEGGTRLALRRRLAGAAFARTAAYDAAVAAWMAREEAAPARRALPLRLAAPLRYGENPHQGAALYLGGEARPGAATAEVAGGKALSFNNLLDADAAVELVAELPRDRAASVIVKHMTPCGAALGATLAEAHGRALAADPVSAFGGIVAVNRPLDGAAAEAIVRVFTEVVAAPGADEEARAVLASRPSLRLLLLAGLPDPGAAGTVWRQVAGGMLVADRDAAPWDRGALRVATSRAPTEGEWDDLRLAWAVAKHARSNAVALAEGGATVGVGAGQTSRVGAVRQAVARLGPGARPVLASDAFFPFPDGVEAALAAGVTAILQPSGARREAEAVAAAERAGAAMVLAPRRHFRH